MEIIACRPRDDQFWIGCSEEEAISIFLPRLSQENKDLYYEIVKNNKHKTQTYWETVLKVTETKEIFHAYFNVSRDLSVCFPEEPHFPFANLWDGYSPYRKIDHKTINSLEELKKLRMIYQGKDYAQSR